jgi:hypothetical protein
VHVIVALTFHGPRPPKAHARHLNGNHFDNRPANLAWGTSRENEHDKRRQGRNSYLTQENCVRGHRLAEPNLTATKKKLGQRNCLACSRARAAVHKAARKGVTLDRQVIADARYAEIMKAAT